MFCNGCGQQVPDGSAFCNRCGKPVTQKQNVTSETSSESRLRAWLTAKLPHQESTSSHRADLNLTCLRPS